MPGKTKVGWKRGETMSMSMQIRMWIRMLKKLAQTVCKNKFNLFERNKIYDQNI